MTFAQCASWWLNINYHSHSISLWAKCQMISGIVSRCLNLVIKANSFATNFYVASIWKLFDIVCLKSVLRDLFIPLFFARKRIFQRIIQRKLNAQQQNQAEVYQLEPCRSNAFIKFNINYQLQLIFVPVLPLWSTIKQSINRIDIEIPYMQYIK